MAILQPVSEYEWERHKDVLRDMYCVKKLPLQSRKGKENDPGVIERMKERHGFFASPSQYELQFKKWGFAKNLKSGEWAALIAQYDLLCQTKSDVRITISGSVLNKDKIDRARRRYRPRHNRSRGAPSTDCTLPASRQAHVEFLDEAGEWHRHSGTEAGNSNALILHKPGHTVEPTSLLDDHIRYQDRPHAHKMRTDLDIIQHEGVVDLVTSCHDLNPSYRSFSPSVDVDGFLNQQLHCFEWHDFTQTDTLGVDNGLVWGLPSSTSTFNDLFDLPSFLENSVGSPVRNGYTPVNDHQEMCMGRAISVAGTLSRLEGARSLITSLVQHSRTTLCYKTGASREMEIPDVEDILENLESLLPETENPQQGISDHTLSMQSASSSNLFKTLLYAFTNNFAGLHDVPRKSLMNVLREHHDIRTQLFESIKAGRPGVSKPLADNLFRAAVEGCDADAVATIIHHTKSNPEIAIDPNGIACNYEGADYTPIELAAKFRNTELVRTLVASRADPNKTYRQEHDEYWEKGALAFALGHWDNGSEFPFTPSPESEYEPVNLDLLRLLLDCGAEVRMDLVENAMRPGPAHTAIAEELLSRIRASNHENCFRSKWLLISIIYYLENSAANKFVRRIFDDCSKSTNCGKCTSKNPKLIERMLCHAARRSNIALTEFLVNYTTQLQSALAAAVRATSEELVRFLLDRGARVNDVVEPGHPHEKFRSPYEYMYKGMYDEDGYDRPRTTSHPEYVVTPIRTPLAEAVRARNDHLINTFERLGALTCLGDEHHFQAALLAAAEVGNVTYLKLVLDRGPRHIDGASFTLALAVAIRNDETDAALVLLDAGANTYSYQRRYGSPLVNALERRNKRVVASMLECDVYDRASSFYDKSALEVAGSWCGIDVIEDLMRSGAHLNGGTKTTALGAAVRSRNKTLVHQLLDLGANPLAWPLDSDGATALRAALEIGDHEMLRLLVSKRMNPPEASKSAFIFAMDHDLAGYEILLAEFKSHYPHGLPGFGGSLFAKAIELDSQPLIESLLGAGADVNSWCKRRPLVVNHDDGPMNNQRVLGFAINHREGRCNELVRTLLRRGAKPNYIVSEREVSSEHGTISVLESPLVLAVKMRNLTMVSLLLEHGADLNMPARRGVKRTPLQAACETGSYKLVEFLLQRGANVNSAAAERDGGTALQMAAKTGSLKIVKLLLDNNADPHMAKSKLGGRSALEAAAENGCLGILCQLWNAVLPFGFGEKECQSAKDFAKQKGHRGCVEFIDFLSGESSQSFLY